MSHPTSALLLLTYGVRPMLLWCTVRNFRKRSIGTSIVDRGSRPRLIYSLTSCCRRKGALQAKECSAIARVRSRRGAWLREGRRMRERRRRCPLPTMVDRNNEQRSSSCSYVCRGLEKTMRVSLRSRDAVRGAVGKYQPLFVIRHFRDGSASRVTGLRRCMLTGLNRATPPLVSGSHK